MLVAIGLVALSYVVTLDVEAPTWLSRFFLLLLVVVIFQNDIRRALTQVGGPFEAVYWDDDGEPSPIPGMTEAHSVNRDGVIAGFSDEGPSVVMADTVLRLQSMISEDSPLDLTNVAAWINDGGSVVCAAYDSDEWT